MGFKFWEADAPPAYDGPITLTPDGGPFLYNEAVPYEMLLAAGVIIPSWLVVYAVMHALLEVKLYDAKKGLIKAPTLAERIDAADGVWCFFFFFVLVGLAFYSTWQLAFTDDSRDRWLGTTAASEAFQIVYVTRMVTHLPVQHYSLSNNPTLRLQMHGHHIITMVAMSGGVLSGRFHFFACLGGCCECAWLLQNLCRASRLLCPPLTRPAPPARAVTTLFLNCLFLLKTLAPDEKYAAAKAVSGLLLWAGFVVFRLVLFPVWLCVFYVDLTVNNAPRMAEGATWFELCFYPATMTFLLVLSSLWMVPLTKGLIKALKKATKKD